MNLSVILRVQDSPFVDLLVHVGDGMARGLSPASAALRDGVLAAGGGRALRLLALGLPLSGLFSAVVGVRGSRFLLLAGCLAARSSSVVVGLVSRGRWGVGPGLAAALRRSPRPRAAEEGALGSVQLVVPRKSVNSALCELRNRGVVSCIRGWTEQFLTRGSAFALPFLRGARGSREISWRVRVSGRPSSSFAASRSWRCRRSALGGPRRSGLGSLPSVPFRRGRLEPAELESAC